MKQSFVIIALVGFTSVAAYLVGAKRIGLPGSRLQKAIGKMFESVGMTLIFFVVNLVLGLIGILVSRVFSRGVSLYLIGDEVWILLALSLFQGLTFQWWQELSVR